MGKWYPLTNVCGSLYCKTLLILLPFYCVGARQLGSSISNRHSPRCCIGSRDSVVLERTSDIFRCDDRLCNSLRSEGLDQVRNVSPRGHQRDSRPRRGACRGSETRHSGYASSSPPRKRRTRCGNASRKMLHLGSRTCAIECPRYHAADLRERAIRHIYGLGRFGSILNGRLRFSVLARCI